MIADIPALGPNQNYLNQKDMQIRGLHIDLKS